MSKNEQVIKFQDKTSDSKEKIHRGIKNKKFPLNNEETQAKKPCISRKRLIILIVVCSVIVLSGIIIMSVFLAKKGGKDNNSQKKQEIFKNETNSERLETEFEFNNKLREPYRIMVEQKYNEEAITNGIKTNQFVGRKTIYCIYIMNETYSNDETYKFFNKTYTAAILISSQCIDTKNEECEPQQMIDLTEATKRNLRTLEEIPDLKDIPLPLCLFNITDNDVITSMLCPPALYKNIRQNMILDLYFFRPPAIKRPDKEANNVTITKETKDGKQFIRETNGGICDVPDSFESFCTTEMNTTTDLDGNILTYDEIAFTNIFHDPNNSYIKNKITNLKDETDKLSNIDKDAYKEALEILIEKLNPYFEYYEEFSVENFKQLYKVSKNISDENRENNSRRNLYQAEEENSPNEEKFFKYRHYTDVNLFLSLINDPGYNSGSMKASINLYTNEEQRELMNCRNDSNFKDIIKLARDLSYAGNNMATEFYNNIKYSLENLDDVILENITNLINLIVDEEKKSLAYIFDSTLNMNDLNVFPIKLVEESTNLKNNLNNLLTNIKNGGMKSKLSILNKDIYSFLSVSHQLLDKVFQNIRSLTNSLKSTKSKLTEIATYYLNNTPDSFNDVIEKAQDLLLNYYKREDDMIITNTSYLIGNFTMKLNKSIESEKIIIDNLLEKLENNYMDIIIENGGDDDKNLLISNLKDSNEIIYSIILKVEELIKKEMNLKENGHFLSDNDILSTNNSYTPDINDGIETSKILDNDEIVDKIFDKTFGEFKDNYTKLMISEKEKLGQQSVFSDNALENGLFSSNNKTYLENNISTLGLKITDNIQQQNDVYLTYANEAINTFIIKNNETLKELINNLTAIISEDVIIQLAESYDAALESSFKTLEDNIETNKELAYNYFSRVAGLFTDNTNIINLLKTFEIDEAHLPYYLYYWSEDHYVYFTKFEDIIQKKSKTIAYMNKYKFFYEKLEISKDYLNQQLQSELKYEYKNTITKLKELLQTIKNSKLSVRFSNYPQLNEIDNNLKDMENLYKIINKHFYDEKYNTDYLPKINNFKKDSINKINYIENNIIEVNHKEINKYKIKNDYNNDFCFGFLRKKTYTCTNGAIFHPDSTSEYCQILKGNENNYNKLISLSIYSDQNFQYYSSSLNNIYTKINNIVSSYTSLINGLSEKLYILEEKANNIDFESSFLKDYKILINDILANNYGKNIILETYDVFREETENRIYKIFNETLIDWENLFKNLYDEVNNNLGNYKNSIKEFGLMSIIYYNYLYTNISDAYYDLMTTHLKKEFNYTISYYYNYLLKVIKSEKQIILSKIPTYDIGFIRVIEQRQKEINQMFDEINDIILKSKDKDLSRYNQLYLLQVPETNFFNISYTLSNFKKQIKIKTEEIPNNIFAINNGKQNDLYSYISRLYLENSLSGKQINEFYKEIDKNDFIYLELHKFQDLIINNWILSQDDFIKLLNNTFYDNNAQILKELSLKKEKYKESLAGELTKYKTFIKNDITFIIDNLYLKAIKEINAKDIKTVEENILSIIQKILYYLSEEEEWISNQNKQYYKNLSLINKTIKGYKENIILELDNKIKEFVNIQRKEIEKEVYSNYYEKYLNIYLNYIKEEIESYEDFSLLNSTYNIGTIIGQIAQELKDEYENTVQNQIIHKYIKYCDNIYNKLNLNQLKEKIENQIDAGYSKLYSVLEQKATIDNKIIGYYNYDLGEDIKKGIDDQIKAKYVVFSTIIESLKGELYTNIDIKNVDEWVIPDFSKISNIVRDIKKSFESFINLQKTSEDKKIRGYIKQTIKFNFDDLINNLIPSFGNEFFERVISYNENFKISYLYDNLKWILSSSISYIEILDVFNNIDQITKDLKIKIYRMNDLDTKILQKNKKIMEELKEKANNFIFDSRSYIIQTYKYFIKKDGSIEMAFSPEIAKLIESVFESGTTEIELDYQVLMEKYLKENLINSYSKLLDEKTEGILRIIRSHRDYLKILLDDIYSIDSDDVLNEINIKLNSTNESLNEYNNHFSRFNISSELVEYLYNYGNDKVHPYFVMIKNLIDNLSKDIIIQNLDKNSEDYESNYNYEIFNNFYQSTYEEIKNQYIHNLDESGHLYYDNYPEKLEIKIQNVTLRRLEDEDNRKIPDKYLDETFNKILNNSLNLKIFIQSLEKFDEFDQKIEKGITNLNLSVLESEELIANNSYTLDVKTNLENRLYYLQNHSLEYYSKINESFYNLRKYLNESISKINDLFNDCVNITIKTFEQKYSDIFDRVNSFNSLIEDEIEKLQKSKEEKTQNYQVTVNTTIENIKGNFLLKYDYQYDTNEIGGIKIPRLSTSIINLSRPKKLTIDIIKDITACAKEIENIEVIFNNVNYSATLDFSPNSRNIISNISGIFDDYYYTVERYNTTDSTTVVCTGNSYNTIKICYPGVCPNTKDKTLIPLYRVPVNKKEFSNTGVISE